MPEISRFYGIIVRMYWNDHEPPHFHALYGASEALIEIDSLELFRGNLPSRALKLVREWAKAHQRELRQNWQAARLHKPLSPIDPLQ